MAKHFIPGEHPNDLPMKTYKDVATQDDPPVKVYKKATLTRHLVNLRQTPSETSKIVRVISSDFVVFVGKTEGDFTESLDHNDELLGYIKTEFLKIEE